MEEKKNEQIINEKQDCQELDDNALEDTSGGIGERHFPDFQREVSDSELEAIRRTNRHREYLSLKWIPTKVP